MNHSYTMFGLQNYGECWSGSDACDQYSRHGDSKLCIGNNYTMCDLNDDRECIGKGNANFVYLLLEGKPLRTLGFTLCFKKKFLFSPDNRNKILASKQRIVKVHL